MYYCNYCYEWALLSEGRLKIMKPIFCDFGKSKTVQWCLLQEVVTEHVCAIGVQWGFNVHESKCVHVLIKVYLPYLWRPDNLCTPWRTMTITIIIAASGKLDNRVNIRGCYTTSSPILKSWLHRKNVLQWQGTCRCWLYVEVQEGANRGLSISINPSLQHGI